MIETPEIKSIYKKIQNELFYMIPEKWDKIYLYASVIKNINNIETGEMFFYYIPKGILKKNPVNVYEVPSKFNIDEEEYNELANNLYETIKVLRKQFKKQNEKLWSNIVISIENFKFNIEYSYENLLTSNYSDEDRNIIFRYKYLDIPIEKFSKKERKIINSYLINQNFENNETYTYTEAMYKNNVHNLVEYNKEDLSQEKEKNNFWKDFKENKNPEKDLKENTSSEKEYKKTKLDKYDMYKKKQEELKNKNIQKNKKENIEDIIEKNIEDNKNKKRNQILNY